jgi:hypothetical protein
MPVHVLLLDGSFLVISLPRWLHVASHFVHVIACETESK